ncbi:MAG TPA: glycosyltransferase family 4 protein [Solirubrobacteraceae bacterium]|jgi:glycosyltransferase involved in cell wall biosynthesis|nr:glycosyltransferase family 4 protein [Solirubrobacteraceae bacterium]
MIGRTVHHFGPDPAEVGGMASVIRVITEHSIGSDDVRFHPTWRWRSRAATCRLTLAAACKIVALRRGEIAHVHLSERGSFVREGILIALARMRGTTAVVTIHGADFLTFAHSRPRLVVAVLGRSSLITCLDTAVLDYVRRVVPRVRAEMLPNPVPMDETSPPADETSEVILFAGEIGIRKGADVLLGAWRMIAAARPSARCIMVGPANGFTVPEVERLTVRGVVGPNEMQALIRSARVVALPSRAEGMPMALTEAMSGGRAFVSTPVGGIPELARSGGVLVPVGDEVELARCLGMFLDSPDLAKRLGERARQYCGETRSVAVIDARLRELYDAARVDALDTRCAPI